MYFSPIISEPALWLLCICFFCVLLIATFYFFRLRTVVTARRRATHERAVKADSDYLPASVVIYSQGDAENLNELLHSILAQDYPAAFEVIVVNEGESADVRDAVSLLRATHHNLYLTFTPEGVVNLSRKKLALTLGIKAARYDVVVLTTTAAIIESAQWLRGIMYPFNSDGKTEIVLGYAYIDPAEDEARGRRRRAFDYVADSARWIGVGVAGKPFRGTEYNIAYRKDVFLRNKGFARTLNLCYGDDDIFVSEVVRPGNTVVELADDSMVRLRHGNHPRIFTERALRGIFTEKFIRRRPRLLWPLTGWMHLGAIATAVAAAIISYPNMQPALIAAVLLILLALTDIYFWRNAMISMRSRSLRLSIPWFAATMPLRKISRRIRSRFGRQKKYTWD